MQYGISIIRRCYLLPVLLMTVWLTGCVQEEFESTPSPAGNGIRFTLTVPVPVIVREDTDGNSKERRRNRNGGYSCF